MKRELLPWIGCAGYLAFPKKPAWWVAMEDGGPGLRYRAEDLEGHWWMFLQK